MLGTTIFEVMLRLHSWEKKKDCRFQWQNNIVLTRFP